MYCSSCGGVLAQGLSYCNFCGAKLKGDKDGSGRVTSSELRAESLIMSAMVGLFVTGLLAIAVLMGVMKAVLNLDAPLIVAFTLLSFLIMLIIEGVLIRQLLRRRRGAEARDDSPAPMRGQATTELDASKQGALPEARSSVTEHTTRTLEPTLSKRRSE